MRYSFRVLVLLLVATVGLSSALAFAADPNGAQASGSKTTAKKTAAKKKPLTVQEQLQQLNNQLTQQQSEIKQQQDQIQTLQQSNSQLQSQVQQQGQALQSSVQDANQKAATAQDGVNSLHTTVTDLQSSATATANSLLETKKSVNALENPLSIHYKGITITPGGWLESTFLVRSKNENANITSSFGGIPFNGVANSNLSEFRASAQGSRAIILAEGKAGTTKLTGYFEMDFVSAAPTANTVQTNSFNMRQRQLWGQAEFQNGITIVAGQFWDLMTTNRAGIATRSVFIPNTIEASYVIGYTYGRQNAFRVVKNWNNKTWGAVEVSNAETTLSTSFTPANLFGFENSANTQTPTATYNPFVSGLTAGISTSFMPDIAGKLVFEPGFGHWEIKALVRGFRDRLPGQNNYAMGGGMGWAAILPLVSGKPPATTNRTWNSATDFIFEGFIGNGIGRYGASAQPDVTVTPNATIKPLPALHTLVGFEIHPQPKLDIFIYGGDEYVGEKRFNVGTAPAGYGSYLVNNSYCNVEVVPTGKPACGAQTKNLGDVTGGFWYRIYKGPFGTLQYGAQAEYIWRNTWSGIGLNGKSNAPSGNDVVGLTSMRFYLP